VGEFNCARVRPAARAIALAALVVVLLTLPALANGGRNSAPARMHPDSGPFAGEVSPSVALTIGGTEYSPEGSTDSNLEGLWNSVPAGCTLSPEWFSWFLPSATSARGTFATPELAATTFVPATLAAGPAEVGVRSVADVGCGGVNRTIAATAFANLTANPPPELVNLSVSPGATLAPATVNLSGVVEGGRPPYLLGVAWNDGNFTNESLAAPGPFRLSHEYGPGNFSPRVAVRDAERLDVRAGVPVPVEVSNSTALTVLAARSLAEVGQPLGFQGVVERPPTHLGISMGCGASVRVPVGANITNLTCVPTAPGTLDVTLEVLAPYPGGDEEVTRSQPVAAPVSLTLRTVDPGLDVGTPTFIEVSLTGGIPPFQVTGSAGDTPLLNLSNVPSDGTFLVPWRPLAPGGMYLDGTVVDSVGATGVAPWARVLVSPTPQLSVRANETVTSPSTGVQVVGILEGGEGPIRWSLTSSIGPANGTAPFGRNASGTFAWTASFSREGTTTLTVEVLDGALSYLNATIQIGLPPAPVLTALRFIAATPPGVLAELSVNWSGGVPPYGLWVNSTAGGVWNGTEGAAGVVTIPLPDVGSGNVSFSVAVTDARGNEASGTITGFVASHPPTIDAQTPPSDPVPWVLGVLLTAILLVFAVRRLRRRVPTTAVPTPDPAQVLEGLLRPAEGADRLTIELMAEEEGIPLDTVQSTIDRLIREGRIRSESDPGGGEVLAWETLSDP
jgi:hypothetical protein